MALMSRRGPLLVKSLSAETRYFRFMDTLRELTPQMLVRSTQIDYDREMAFVATVPEDGREAEVGVARYVANPDGESCEFALVVADDWQRKGLGRRLMGQLIDVARARAALDDRPRAGREPRHAAALPEPRFLDHRQRRGRDDQARDAGAGLASRGADRASTLPIATPNRTLESSVAA